MKKFLTGNFSKRFGYSGWALKVIGAKMPLHWTTSTTRAEARQVKKELELDLPDLFRKLEVVKVKITVTEVSK